MTHMTRQGTFLEKTDLTENGYGVFNPYIVIDNHGYDGNHINLTDA